MTASLDVLTVELGEPELRQVHRLEADDLTLPAPVVEDEGESDED